jgi:replicative DNA helicase
MRNFTLVDDFTDQAAERGLLSALNADPGTLSTLKPLLSLDLFTAGQRDSAEQLLERHSSAEIPPDWTPAADPAEAITVLRDLRDRRRIAELQEHLASMLYDPQRPVSDADALIDAWKSEAKSETGATSVVNAVASSELLDRVLADSAERLSRRRAEGKPVMGVATSLPKLDQLLNGLNPGLHVLGGAPGAGKTTLALQMAVHAASTGVPVLYVTYENSPGNLILKALCAAAELIPLDVERGYGDLDKLTAAMTKLRPALERLSIIEGTLRLTSSGIRNIARNWFQGQRGLIVIDYLQRAAHHQGYDQIRQNVSRLAAELREISSALDSPILALASQNRSSGDYGRGGGSAHLDSLKESGDLEYGADSVMFLRSDKNRPQPDPSRGIEIAVVKNRFGPLGGLPLIYRADTGVIREHPGRYTMQWVGDE